MLCNLIGVQYIVLAHIYSVVSVYFTLYIIDGARTAGSRALDSMLPQCPKRYVGTYIHVCGQVIVHCYSVIFTEYLRGLPHHKEDNKICGVTAEDFK